MDKICVAVVVTALVAIGFAFFYEASFDWSACKPRDEYRERHQAMWIQHMPRVCSGSPQVCTGGFNIIHPARDWTEQKYLCLKDEGAGGYFVKWRTVQTRQNHDECYCATDSSQF